MSEIDKALPNEVRKEINIPSADEIQVELEKEQKQIRDMVKLKSSGKKLREIQFHQIGHQ